MLFILVFYLSYLVIQPFLTVILTAVILAYLFFPLYKWINKKLKNSYLSAASVIFIILLIVAIPVIFVLNSLYNEASSTVNMLTKLISKGGVSFFNEKFALNIDKLDAAFPAMNLKDNLEAYAISVIKLISNKVSTLLFSISYRFINFIISLFLTFFLLIDGKKLIDTMKKLFSLKKSHERHIMTTLQETTHAVVFGQIVVALIQGAIATIGYWLIGSSPNAIMWGLITAFFALIPYVGTVIIWLPFSLYLFVEGLSSGYSSYYIRAVALFLYGLLIISTIDNFLKPKIIGSRARVHPAIVFVGVIGGMHLMGVLGIIIGPIILSVLITFVKLFELEKAEMNKGNNT